MSDREMTATEIGAELGLSRQVVEQTEARALRKGRRIRLFGGEPPSFDDSDPWRSLPGFAPGCRQVGALRWRK